MKTFTPLSRPLPGRVFLAPVIAVVLAGTAVAQQSPYYQQNASAYQSQPPHNGYSQQRPGVGERVGGFVRRMFYGDPAPSYQQPPQYGYQPGRSLDGQPSASPRYETPAQPQVSSRPPVTASSSTPAKTASTPPKTSTTTSKPAPSSSSKYTPPKLKSDAPPATSKPAPTSAPAKTQSTPPAPATKTESKVEKEPPAPKLNNSPTLPPTTVASMNKSLPSLDIPAIKQPESTPGATSVTETPKEPTPPPASNSTSGQFLVGKKTAVPGRVISPYPPYQELDVSGLASGSLALDPTTDKVFEIP